MVFSFFKKDSKASAKGRGSSAGQDARSKPSAGARTSASQRPAGRLGQTDTTQTNRDFHRTLAMETAAKIDAIESEMTRDFLRPVGTRAQHDTTNANAKPAANSAFLAQGRPAQGPETHSDDDLGNVNAIEINTSGAGSVIDETAILFANGLAAEAQNELSTALAQDTVGHNIQTAWRMLFELLNQSGDRDAFEKMAMDYVLRFGHSPPAWMDYQAGAPAALSAPVAAPAAATAAPIAPATDGLGDEPIVDLPATVDAGVVKHLEALKAHAARHPALVLDASAVKSIDLVGAELLLRVVSAFKRAAHELTLVGPERLCEALQRAVQPGRRDPSDAGWMLLLEMLRLLERQTDFEETGIQYCITYEVSPPSWEPISPNMRTEPARPLATPAAPAAAAPQTGGSGSGLRWYGQIEGEGEPHFGRVALAAQHFEGTLTVDCRQLQRMSFSAGSALLNLTLRLQQAGVTLQLLDVNALVGALLHLLGVTAVCAVQLRRD